MAERFWSKEYQINKEEFERRKAEDDKKYKDQVDFIDKLSPDTKKDVLKAAERSISKKYFSTLDKKLQKQIIIAQAIRLIDGRDFSIPTSILQKRGEKWVPK